MYLGKNTNVTKAIKEVIKDYMQKEAIGREDIADELGIVKGTLDNKLKLSMPGNSFTVEEILKLTEITEDGRILQTMCTECGMTAFDPIEAMPDGGDIVHALLLGSLNIESIIGNFADTLKGSIEDLEIDSTEIEQMSQILISLRAICRRIELTLSNSKKA